MGQLKKLAGQTAIYGASSIIGRLLNWLLVPFYTGIFLPEEYGVVVAVSSYAAFLSIVFTYGLETTFFRFSTKANADKPRVYGQIMTLILVSSLILTAIIYGPADTVATAIQFQGMGTLVRWVVLGLALDAILSIPFAKLRLENRAVKFASLKLLNIFTNIFLNLLFLWIAPKVTKEEAFTFLSPVIEPWYNPSLGVEYIFISNFLSGLILIPFLLKEIVRFRLTWSAPVVRSILIYSIPIALMGLAGSINETFGRLMIKYLLPEGFYGHADPDYAVGVFGACFKLSIFMNLCIQAFRFAAEPFFFSNAAEKNSPQLFSKVMKWFVIFGAVVFLGISLNLSWIGLLLRDAAYREALYIVPFLLMGYLFFGIYYNLSVWYKLTDRTYYGAYISTLGAFVTIMGNIILIPLAGYFGAAFAMLLAFVVMAVVSYFLGEKHYPVPYKVGNALFYILLSSGVVFLMTGVKFDNFLMELVVNNVLVIGFLCVVLFKERKDLPLPKRFIS